MDNKLTTGDRKWWALSDERLLQELWSFIKGSAHQNYNKNMVYTAITVTNLSRVSVKFTLDNPQTSKSTVFVGTVFSEERSFMQGWITKRAKHATPPGTFWSPGGPRVFVCNYCVVIWFIVKSSNYKGLKVASAIWNCLKALSCKGALYQNLV